ncbi:MAG: hypothetical protein HFE75_08710 [Firmicutes bacterium]|jgi:hypothetical protein|nr:hypothetical protein [Bacillota bacterium]
MATAHTLYDNFVLENKITDLMNTKLDIRSLFTVDNSLTQAAGLRKTVNKYTYTGEVEKLAKGAKNTKRGKVTFVPTHYDVERYQQTYDYNDMDVMQDPMIVDVASRGAAEVMVNEIKTQYFTELAKISNSFQYDSALNYDAVVDALAAIGEEVEDGMFLMLGLDGKQQIRKDPDFKASRQGEILYTGQFGTISGLPVCFSKLMPKDTSYITKKDAITFFVKKEGSVEQDRDIETKDNTVVYERHGLIALTDDTKSIKLTKKASG